MSTAFAGTKSNFKVGNHRVTFNSVDLGYTVEGSEITIEREYRELRGDQTTAALGKRLVSEKMSISLRLREFTAANLAKALPGSTLTGSTKVEDGGYYAGAIDLYDYAYALNLHPLDKDDAVLTADWNVYKATLSIAGPIPAKAGEDMVVPVEVHVFPDTSKAIGKQLFAFGA